MEKETLARAEKVTKDFHTGDIVVRTTAWSEDSSTLNPQRWTSGASSKTRSRSSSRPTLFSRNTLN